MWEYYFPQNGLFNLVLPIILFSSHPDGQEPVLEATLSSLEIKTSSAKAVWAATGTLGSVQVMMHSVG